MIEVLLDTHAWIWWLEGLPMQNQAALEAAEQSNSLLVSPISSWEIGLLAALGRISLRKPASKWVEDGLRVLRLTPLTPEIAVNASFLPGALHKDPADRLLVSTARSLGARLATRDSRILDYARAGHVMALEV